MRQIFNQMAKFRLNICRILVEYLSHSCFNFGDLVEYLSHVISDRLTSWRATNIQLNRGLKKKMRQIFNQMKNQNMSGSPVFMRVCGFFGKKWQNTKKNFFEVYI